jgi:tRNA threonylcarbamoyladenosine biosynthesis protein TsaB
MLDKNMILFINTTNAEVMEIIVSDNNSKIVGKKKIKAKYKQAEKLLLEIDKLLKKQKIKLNKLKQIKVVNFGGSFTALRIGVLTANTLGYALNIPVQGSRGAARKFKNFIIVEPIYNR